MSSHDALPPDDLDTLLSSAPATAKEGLRRAILRQTTRVVRRRRYARRALWAAAMLACYAAGATTMQFWNHSTSDISLPMVHQAAAPHPSVLQAVPSPSTAVEIVRSKPANPPAAPLSRYERLRRYSDRLLEQQGDIAQATRYYVCALQKASPEERAISVEDTWLLAALKADRLKEKTHENHGS